MAHIKLDVSPNEPIITGMLYSFRAPCDCTSTQQLLVGMEYYTLVDSMGNPVNGKIGMWCSGALITVVLDAENKKAYVMNAGALHTNGGDMSGNIDMNGNRILGLSTPTQTTEPVTLGMFNNHTHDYAPSGYGLGTANNMQTIKTETQLDSAKASGWYKLNLEFTPSFGFKTGLMRVDAGNGAVHQTVYAFDNNWNQRIVTRVSAPGLFEGEWEWVNPPMDVGTVYRTTERYKGKPVYAQLIVTSIDSSASTKQIYTGDSSVRLHSIEAIARKTSPGSHVYKIPDHADSDYSEHEMYMTTSNYTVSLFYNVPSGTTFDIECLIKYTK